MREFINVYRIAAVFLLTTLSFALMGFGFNRPEIVLDTTKNIIYQNTDPETINKDFEADRKRAEGLYKNNYYSVRGRIYSKNKDNKEFTLTGEKGGNDQGVRCIANNEGIISMISGLNLDDVVNVYGKFGTDFISKEIKLSVDHIELSKGARPLTMYSMVDGSSIDKKNMEKRTLNNDKISFLIPPSWGTVEHSINDEKLGEVEGFQYRLNDLKTSPSVEPESIFVFYFDNKMLKNSDDKKQTVLIEKAILSNILNKPADKLGKFPLIKDTTYYGDKYNYYKDAYQKPGENGYRTEFVFQNYEDEGIIAFLYLYKDTHNVNDILFMMRLFDK